jgi:hypothetical protein
MIRSVKALSSMKVAANMKDNSRTTIDMARASTHILQKNNGTEQK